MGGANALDWQDARATEGLRESDESQLERSFMNGAIQSNTLRTVRTPTWMNSTSVWLNDTMHAFGVTRTCAKLCAWSKRRWLNTIQLSLWDCAGKYEARFQGLEAAVSGVSIGVIYRIFKSEGCWWEMPGDREDEICGKALELLSDLCSRGEVQDDNCLDFTYYFRDLGRPRYSDSGEYFVLSNVMSKIFYCCVSVRFCLSYSKTP